MSHMNSQIFFVSHSGNTFQLTNVKISNLKKKNISIAAQTSKNMLFYLQTNQYWINPPVETRLIILRIKTKQNTSQKSIDT